jgi:hypothetical protein
MTDEGEIVDPISSWLQLIDSSEILRFEEVDNAFKRAFKDDETTDVDGPLWNRDQTRPMRFNVFTLVGPPPDFVEVLDEVSEQLREGEYLIFSQLSRFEYSTATARTIIVTSQICKWISNQPHVDHLKRAAGIVEAPAPENEPDL